ncbi:hypothetical protein V1477_001433 [Vespula maculifrons]|uniref:Uncharacterized protein n=1 Tax=Vespula maculifrons TaxID=7453 RepID=A0ABD2CZ03_VESMC
MKIDHTVNSVVGYRTNVNLGSSANQCWKEEEEKSDGGDEEVEDGDEEHESTLVYKIEMILRDVGKIKSICSTFTSPCHPYSINLN